jgi:predicted transcriptional regulator
MAESRVARWRERLRQGGKKAITVWLSAEEELRLKDLAVQWHTSPSEIMQHALAQFHPGRPPSLSDASETTQQQHSAMADSSQIQATLEALLPGMVRQMVEEITLEAQSRSSVVTEDTQRRSSAATDERQMSSSDVADISKPIQPQRRTGRQRSPMGQRILDLLTQRPEGLTAEQMRAELQPATPIGDILQGMVKTGVAQLAGEGRQRRYVLSPGRG